MYRLVETCGGLNQEIYLDHQKKSGILLLKYCFAIRSNLILTIYGLWELDCYLCMVMVIFISRKCISIYVHFCVWISRFLKKWKRSFTLHYWGVNYHIIWVISNKALYKYVLVVVVVLLYLCLIVISWQTQCVSQQ